jgi:hypothetical protein
MELSALLKSYAYELVIGNDSIEMKVFCLEGLFLELITSKDKLLWLVHTKEHLEFSVSS